MLDEIEDLIHQRNREVMQLVNNQRIVEGYELAVENLKLAREHLSENSPYLATALTNLGAIFQMVGDHIKALEYSEASLEILRQIKDRDQLHYAIVLNNVALLTEKIGDPNQALPLYEEAVQVLKRHVGTENRQYAMLVHNYAALIAELGDYERAREMNLEALQIRLKGLGRGHTETAESLGNLARVFSDLENYEEAISYFHQAIDSYRQALGENHPKLASVYNNLAATYAIKGDFEEALSFSSEAVRILKETAGEDHPAVIDAVKTVADYLRLKGDFSAAETHYQEILASEDPDNDASLESRASALTNLATLYEFQGDLAKAIALTEQALHIRRHKAGEHHPSVVETLYELAWLLAGNGQMEQALDEALKAAALEDRLVVEGLSLGSERQRLQYFRSLRGHFEGLLSLVNQFFSDSSEAVQAAYDLVLKRKGAGIDALAIQRAAILGDRYPELRPKLEELTRLKLALAKERMTHTLPVGFHIPEHVLAQWDEEKEALEAQLVALLPRDFLERELLETDLHEVVEALPPDTALVEFIYADRRTFKSQEGEGVSRQRPARCLAFVLQAGEPPRVELVDLGEAAQLNEKIAAFRQAVTGDGRFARSADPVAEVQASRHISAGSQEARSPDVLEAGIALRRAVFDPLLPALDSCRSMILAPDGELTQLPFEALPLAENHWLIDDYYFSYLNVGRDLARRRQPSSKVSAPLIIADPDFDLPDPYPPAAVEYSMEQLLEGLDRDALQFLPLAGAREEGRRIAALLGVQPLMGEAATKEALKNARSPRILHVATHGYFLSASLPSEQAGRAAEGRSPSLDRLATSLENPLLRAGLALAGANDWNRVSSDDGLLTAEDVTGLDLLDTELVVLSACDTGLGDVEAGEGVFGLRRAFTLAGARSLVMSLWKIPDYQTQELMADFYERLLAGEPRTAALREAQLGLKERYRDPYFWGAFIFQGDPSPLRAAWDN